MSETEKSSNANEQADRKGLSKEAWVAISSIAAALITGIVTLVIHLIPPKAVTPTALTTAPAANVSTAVSTSSRLTADAIAGKWSGKGTAATGESFDITLEIKKSCGLHEKCGVMTMSHLPCYGEILLDKVRDPVYDFDLENLYGQSGPECARGPGEVFQLRPDGKLDYHANYEPGADGVLERINN